MRIERLYVDGFGHFARASIGPLHPRLTVLYGPNEAGKSTLLAFLRTVLFGFPKHGRSDHYPPLLGGEHGGLVTVIDDNGRNWNISRKETVRGVVLDIVGPDGSRSQHPEDLAPLLGNASISTFDNVFGFGLADLQQMKALADDAVTAEIFNAGMGARAVPAALASLRKKKERLFKKQGRKEDQILILGALAELEELDAKLEKAREAAGKYAQLANERDRLAAESLEVQRRGAALQQQYQHLFTLRTAWNDWIAMGIAKQRLVELPEVPGFPEDALIRLERLDQRIEGARATEDEARRAMAFRRKQAETVSPDEALLDHAAEIEELQRGRGAFERSCADIVNRRTDVLEGDRILDNALRALGPSWSEARVESFDDSTETRAIVDRWSTRLAELDRTLSDARNAEARACEALNDAAAAFAGAEATVQNCPQPAIDEATIVQNRLKVRQARQRLADYQRAVERREDFEVQLRSRGDVVAPVARVAVPRWLAAALGALGILAITAGVVAGGDSTVFGVGVGAVLLGTAAWSTLAARRDAPAAPGTPPDLAPALDGLRERERSAAEALDQSTRNLGLQSVTAEALIAADEALDRAAEVLRARQTAESALAAAKLHHDRLETVQLDAAGCLEAAATEWSSESASWRKWLSARGLAEELLPATVPTVFARVELARNAIAEAARRADRLSKIQDNITAYGDQVRTLVTASGLDFATDSVGETADEIFRRYKAASEAAARRRQVGDDLVELQEAYESAKTTHAAALSDMEALLNQGHCADTEQFRRVAREQEERADQLRQARDCEVRLIRLSGPGAGYQRLKDELDHATPETIESSISAVEAALAEHAERTRELVVNETTVTSQLTALTSDEESSRLRLEREVVRERLEAFAREWSVLTVAETLLDEAQRKYERERQPDVVRNAQAFFTAITGGRYRRILAPLGARTVEVEDFAGHVKTPPQLSQGTREQLYLALRFGLVQHFAGQAIRLPVIVDDVLVNFDPERAQRAAQAFVTLADTAQVVVFTCHPSTVELFRAADPGVQVIDITSIASTRQLL